MYKIICMFLFLIIFSIFTIRIIHIEAFDGLILIDEDESEYQTIQLFQDNSRGTYCLFLNNVIQNTSEDAHKTHDMMINLSVKLRGSRHLNSILILGGGDGYPAMYALQHENVNVTNVEIDETLVNFIKNNKYTKKLTNNAFNNPMLKMINEDAYDYIYKDTTKYDVIVHDIEMETNQNYEHFRQHDMHIFENMLSENGVLNYTDDYAENEAIGEMKYISQILEKKQSQANSKKFNVLIFTTPKDFEYLQTFLFDPVQVKETYHNRDVGIYFRSFSDAKCGTGEDGVYGDEFYMYISKNSFQKEDPDIHFEYFNDLK